MIHGIDHERTTKDVKITVVREEGSEHIILSAPAIRGRDVINELNQQIVIGSTEGIKQYLKHSNCYALFRVFHPRRTGLAAC